MTVSGVAWGKPADPAPWEDSAKDKKGTITILKSEKDTTSSTPLGTGGRTVNQGTKISCPAGFKPLAGAKFRIFADKDKANAYAYWLRCDSYDDDFGCA